MSTMEELSAADTARFESERPRLTGLAYRLLGSLTDAEDVVQEAWLRWERADRTTIERPEAWLTTVVSRLGLDRLRANQRERDRYVGPWLPEPLVERGDPAGHAELADSLTTAFLLLLEELSPTERLTILLADVFDEPFADVATVLGKSEAAVRQQAVRARRKLREAAPAGRPPTQPEQLRVAEAFLAATAAGDVDTVLSLLAPDVVLVSDGGANHHAARRPVVGPHRVGRLMINLASRIPEGATVDLGSVNGSPGIVVEIDGHAAFVVAVEVVEARVQGIRVVVNPDKLAAVDRP
ncbi:MAG TPA: RNA polymerase sigma factor SigJ, partial [Acidimicrobiales bacterium]